MNGPAHRMLLALVCVHSVATERSESAPSRVAPTFLAKRVSNATAWSEPSKDIPKDEGPSNWLDRVVIWANAMQQECLKSKYCYPPPSYRTFLLQALVSWGIFVVFALLVWRFAYPADSELTASFADSRNDPIKTFTSRHFGCFSTPMITFCACFCPGLRWADTVSLGGLLRFSSAFMAFYMCGLLDVVSFTGSIYYGLLTGILILFNRHKLRARLGLPNWTCSSCCIDFFYVFCCTCCAIAQEARVVKYAHQQGMMGVQRNAPSLAPAPAARLYAYRSDVPPTGAVSAGLQRGYGSTSYQTPTTRPSPMVSTRLAPAPNTMPSYVSAAQAVPPTYRPPPTQQPYGSYQYR